MTEAWTLLIKNNYTQNKNGNCVHYGAVQPSWNVMAHGDARVEKWRGNWRKEWVASTLTLPRNMVYPALLPLMRTPRLPVVDWTDAPADSNGLVCFAERWNLVSARVPSHFKRSLHTTTYGVICRSFSLLKNGNNGIYSLPHRISKCEETDGKYHVRPYINRSSVMN